MYAAGCKYLTTVKAQSIQYVAGTCITHVCRPWSGGRSQHGRNLSRKHTRRLVAAATSCEEGTWCSTRLWRKLCRYQVCMLGENNTGLEAVLCSALRHYPFFVLIVGINYTFTHVFQTIELAHHRGSDMVNKHRHSGEKGKAAPLPPQVAEEI